MDKNKLAMVLNVLIISVNFIHSLKKPEPKKNKVRMGVLLNNETVKEIANIGAGLNNINDTSSKKEATVFVVLDMHPGLMNPTETLGRYNCTTSTILLY